MKPSSVESIAEDCSVSTSGDSPATTKVKVTLDLPNSHPLINALKELNCRGLKPKEIDCGQIIIDALGIPDQDFWHHQIQLQTPLQWKVERALLDPKLKSLIVDVLDSPREECGEGLLKAVH